jgi:hypothetical protein
VSPSRWRRGFFGLGAALIGGTLLSALPLCPLANITGWPCPSCGLTRATVALLHGDLGQSLALQPLTPLVLALLCAFGGGAWLGYVRTGELVPPWSGTHPRIQRVLEIAAAGACVALVALWLARFGGLMGGPVPVQARWLEAVLALR